MKKQYTAFWPLGGAAGQRNESIGEITVKIH